MPLTLGTRLDFYEIVALIGAGGMGEVYRARDTSLKRDVAIKVLPTSYSFDPGRLRRFQLEAEAAAALNHPNILSVFHIGQQDGSPYIVSELLEGETLRTRLRRGPMPLHEALETAIEVTHGLAAAHEKGITHRDLKPENLFVTRDGRVKILDFGLAKLSQPQSADEGAATVSLHEQTRPGQVLGTVGYMAPEQLRGLPADARSEIFAFGAVLYEMLTGRRAFPGSSSADVISAILHSDPPALSSTSGEMPPAVTRIVRRCLEKSPERRFQSAHDLGYALEVAGAGSDSTPSIDSDNMRPRKRPSVKWLAAALALCVVIAVLYMWSAPAIQRELRLRQLQQLTAVPLTALPGNVESPTFSPDGS
jgi:serine/threonine protein kinase